MGSEMCIRDRMSSGGISIINVINESNLKPESKEYFRNALSFTEGGTYAQSRNSNGRNIVFEKKHFDELMKNI